MEYQTGNYVVYNGAEICRIGETVKKCFDGVNENKYYKLYPNDSKSTYYVPADKIESSVRSVLTKEQLSKLINELSDSSTEWISDRSERKDAFSDAIKKGDYRRIFSLMNGIYMEKNNSEKKGKQLLNYDKRNFELAKKIFQSEVAIAFEISPDEAEELIKKLPQKI